MDVGLNGSAEMRRRRAGREATMIIKGASMEEVRRGRMLDAGPGI